MYPKSIKNLVESFKYFSGIGEKTAERLAFSILNMDQEQVQKLSESIKNAKIKIKKCQKCNNITENEICDICKDSIYFCKSYEIEIIQMDDGNIIKYCDGVIKLFKITKHDCEELQIIENEEGHLGYEQILKLSDEKILSRDLENRFELFSYQNGKLISSKKYFNIQEEYTVYNYCKINEDEIAIYMKKSSFLFGQDTEFIMFYDVKNFKQIKLLKLGKGIFSGQIYKNLCLFNNDYLIVSAIDKKLVFIEIKNRKIVKEFENLLLHEHCDIFFLNYINFGVLDDNIFKIFEFRNLYILGGSKRESGYKIYCNNKFIYKRKKNNIKIYNNAFDFVYEYK